jgi:hypothetical protein
MIKSSLPTGWGYPIPEDEELSDEQESVFTTQFQRDYSSSASLVYHQLSQHRSYRDGTLRIYPIF